MRKFTYQEAEEIAEGFFPGAEYIEGNDLGKTGRWTIGHEIIFSLDGKFYSLTYHSSASESNEGSGTFEGSYYGDEDHYEDICEVKPVEVVVKKWVPV